MDIFHLGANTFALLSCEKDERIVESYIKAVKEEISEDLHIIRTIQANSILSQRLREAFKNNKVHAYFQAIQNIQNLINRLHDNGFLIAIDDFGTRCSNFAQLNNLKIDFIKIDGEFIKNIVEDKNTQIITKTILNYTKQAEIQVVAEFVCSREVYLYIKDLGVDFAQGYFIAEPSPELFV